jgi:catechol-2,3-dioxygenase
MTPSPLIAIDHLHLHVRHRPSAERWYAEVLGLRRVVALAHWAADGGPLTLADPGGVLHLAVFEHPATPPQPHRGTVALRIDPEQAGAWREHLRKALGSAPAVVDHGVTRSLYFHDPDGDPFELTWPSGAAPA